MSEAVRKKADVVVQLQQKTAFSIVPAELLTDPHLTNTAKVLYSILVGYPSFRKYGESWVSNTTLSDRMGVSLPTVKRALKSLRDQGYLEPSGQKGKGPGGRRTQKIRGGQRLKNDPLKAHFRSFHIEEKEKKDDEYPSDIHHPSGGSSSPSDMEGDSMRTIPPPPSRRSARKVLEKPEPEKSSRKSSLVEYWNHLPGYHRKHHNPSSQLYRSISLRLHKMRQDPGFFSSHGLDPGWVSSRRIPDKALRNIQWSEELIQQGMRSLVEAMDLESSLPDRIKEQLRGMDLGTLIYNPRSRKSMFLGFLYRPAKKDSSQDFKMPGHLRGVQLPEGDRARAALLSLERAVRKHRESFDEPWAREKAGLVFRRILEWRSGCGGSDVGLPGGVELLEMYSDWIDEKRKTINSLDQCGPGTVSWKWFVRLVLEKTLDRQLPDGMVGDDKD